MNNKRHIKRTISKYLFFPTSENHDRVSIFETILQFDKEFAEKLGGDTFSLFNN